MELAKIFARNKTDLILIARSGDKLISVKSELEKDHDVHVDVIVQDLSIDGSANLVYNEVKKLGRSVDYLVNNAGFGDYGFFWETDWEKENKMMKLNMISLVALTKLFMQDMMEQGQGRIMNLASTAAFLPGPLMAVYYATKAFVLSFSQAIANELNDKGITVTALCPGMTESGFQAASDLEESKALKRMSMASVESVAKYGYKAMMKGKRVAIHRFDNKLIMGMLRFIPRKMAASIARKLFEK